MNNNEIISESLTQEEIINLAKKKETYEECGIPVERFFYCCGLPMTSN